MLRFKGGGVSPVSNGIITVEVCFLQTSIASSVESTPVDSGWQLPDATRVSDEGAEISLPKFQFERVLVVMVDVNRILAGVNCVPQVSMPYQTWIDSWYISRRFFARQGAINGGGDQARSRDVRMNGVEK